MGQKLSRISQTANRNQAFCKTSKKISLSYHSLLWVLKSFLPPNIRTGLRLFQLREQLADGQIAKVRSTHLVSQLLGAEDCFSTQRVLCLNIRPKQSFLLAQVTGNKPSRELGAREAQDWLRVCLNQQQRNLGMGDIQKSGWVKIYHQAPPYSTPPAANLWFRGKTQSQKRIWKKIQ